MLQVIHEREFKLILAPQWSEGFDKPIVSPQRWVVFAKQFPDDPYVFDKLEDAIKWIEIKAGMRQASASWVETDQRK